MEYTQEFPTDKKDNRVNAINAQLNLEKLEKIDSEAKKKGQLLHRFFTIPVADGEAFYQIISVKKRTVKVKRCTGIYLDEYQDAALEISPEILLGFAQAQISFKDLGF